MYFSFLRNERKEENELKIKTLTEWNYENWKWNKMKNRTEVGTVF